LTDITTTNNEAGYGGGTSINLSAGLLVTLERVTYRDNVGIFAGATDVYDASAVMTDCVLENNVGDAAWAAVLVDTDGHLESVQSEWGSGATENTPFDVILSLGLGALNPTYNYGTAASFVCDQVAGACI
jgi:hypothetical protein